MILIPVSVFVLLAIAIAGLVVWASRLEPHGAHTLADPADRTDPDGAKYIGALMEDPDDELWEQRAGELAAAPGRLDMLPPDPPADITGVQDHDVKYLGMTSDEFVTGLLEKHAPKPEMLP